jgi:hypothetical protein
VLFEQLRSKEQQQAFAQLAYLVAKADGSVSLADMTLIDLFGVEAVFSSAKTPESTDSITELCDVFEEPMIKETIYSNLLSFAYTEKFENQNQRKVLDKIRDALGIKHTEEARCRKWLRVVQGTYFPVFSE